MKKIFVTILSLVCIFTATFGLTACNDNNDSSEDGMGGALI